LSGFEFRLPLYPNRAIGSYIAVLLGSILLVSLALAVYNYWLSKKVFNLTKKQAIFIGVIMGIFTNPILALIIISLL